MATFSRTTITTVAGLVLIFLNAGCTTTSTVDTNASSNRPSNLEQNRLFDSTLWFQTAAEYHASTLMMYRNAGEKLSCPTQSNGAIVMDVDETVLDNSPFQAQLILKAQSEFDAALWDNWVMLGEAEPVPGAVNYVKKAVSCGYRVVFITNRECSTNQCPQKAATQKNLERHGIPAKDENVLLRGEKKEWGGDKQSRRDFLKSQGYTIEFMFGDDLNDFLTGVRNVTPKVRLDKVRSHAVKWGTNWFVLPNPMYGSWKRVLQAPHQKYLRDSAQKP